MREATDWTEKYYSQRAAEVLREWRAALTPKQLAEIGARWQALFADLQTSVDSGVSPERAEGRAFFARFMRLAYEFSNGDAEIGEGNRELFEEGSHWPDDERAAKLTAGTPNAEYRAFFNQAIQACLRHG